MKDLYVGDLDLVQCLGLPPVEEAAEESNDDNGRSTINSIDDGEDIQYDLEDAEIDLDDEFFGRLDKAEAGPLLGLCARMLEVCGGLIAFPLAPLQSLATIFIPFNHAFFNKDFFPHFDHFSRLYITAKEDELQRLQAMFAVQQSPQVEGQITLLQQGISSEYAHVVTSFSNHHSPLLLEIAILSSSARELKKVSSLNLFDELYSIKHRAFMSRGNVKKISISKRNYCRWLDKKIPGHDEVEGNVKRRFTARPYFRTDGIRISAIYVDWMRSKREDMSPRYLKEIRRTTREDLIQLHHPQELVIDPDLSNYYHGVIGLDFGQVCAAASVYRPVDQTLSGSQLVIKRRFLYGGTKSFMNWMQKRKRRAELNILAIEEGLSRGSIQGSMEQYTIFLNELKMQGRGAQLYEFYSHPTWKRRKWNNAISQRSAVDKACSLIMNQASSERHGNETGAASDIRPLIFAMGMDGLSTKARKGNPSPMDHKLSKALYHKIRQINASRPKLQRHAITRVDEYYTSKTCCRCIKEREDLPLEEQVEYMGRPPRYSDARSRIGNDGLFRTFRVVHCNACNRIFHRDGNAAENMCTIIQFYMRYHRRPSKFIRPSRRNIPGL